MTAPWSSRLLSAPVGPMLAPRLARVVLLTVLVGFGLAALIADIRAVSTTWHLAVVFLCLPGILAIQIGYFGRQMHVTHPHLAPVVLIVHGFLAWGPVLVLGASWLGQIGFFAGSVLLTTSPRIAIAAAGAMAVAVGAIGWASGFIVLDVLYAVISTVISASIVFGLTTLAGSVVQLHRARAQLATMAVEAERNRFARDLHDLLGYSLSAITLKSELARAVVAEQPERAKEELGELIGISRQALRDVRRVAHGGGDPSIGEEVEAARSLLVAAGIEVRARAEIPDVAGHVAVAVAAVVREAVTNILRHSEATVCRIDLTPDRDILGVRIANNGIAGRETGPAPAKGGLRNMSERVAALGGTVVTAVDGDWFVVTATLPLPPQTT